MSILAAVASVAIPSLIQTIMGGRQISKANNMNPARPTLKTTSGLKEILRETKSARNNALPGRVQAESGIATAGANALETAESASTQSSDILQALPAVQQGQNTAINELNTKEVVYKDEKNKEYLNALAMLSEEEKDQFEYNENSPYQRALAEKLARLQAGNTMLGQGVSGLSGIGTALLGNPDLKSLFSSGTPPVTTP